MKKPRRVRIAGRILILIMFMGEGSLASPTVPSQRSSPPAGKSMIVVDSLSRRVAIPSRVERIISLQPEMTRILIALGVGERLVGSEYFMRRFDPLVGITFPRERRLPLVSAGAQSVNAEMVLRLNPDVIFAPPEDLSLSDSLQEKTGKPVVALSSMGRFERLMEEIKLAGAVTGREERAAELVSYFQAILTRIRGEIGEGADQSRPRVYLSLWGALNRTPVSYEPIAAAGGVNVAEGLLATLKASVQATINIERILKWNPDIILIHGNFRPETRLVTVEGVLSDARLASLGAVKNKKVYYTFGFANWWDPAEVLVETLQLVRLFHPNRFGGIDLEAEGNAVFKKFYGIENGFTALSGILECHDWVRR